MSASVTSPFALELRQGSPTGAPSSTVRDRGTGPVASWLRTAFSRFRTAPRRTPQDIGAAAPVVGGMAAAPGCRMCGTPGTRRVCATCATTGFIELGCGCVQRPDGSRYACDDAVERWLDTPLPGDVDYDPSVGSACDAWADAARESGVCAGHMTSFRDASWEQVWSRR